MTCQWGDAALQIGKNSDSWSASISYVVGQKRSTRFLHRSRKSLKPIRMKSTRSKISGKAVNSELHLTWLTLTKDTSWLGTSWLASSTWLASGLIPSYLRFISSHLGRSTFGAMSKSVQSSSYSICSWHPSPEYQKKRRSNLRTMHWQSRRNTS